MVVTHCAQGCPLFIVTKFRCTTVVSNLNSITKLVVSRSIRSIRGRTITTSQGASIWSRSYSTISWERGYSKRWERSSSISPISSSIARIRAGVRNYRGTSITQASIVVKILALSHC